MAAVIAAAALGGGCFRPATAGGEYEVDVLEDEAALAVKRPSGRAVTLPRAALPPNVREGDVVVDGRVDPILTAQLRDDVRTARERLHRVHPAANGALDLDHPAPELDSTRGAEVASEAAETR